MALKLRAPHAAAWLIPLLYAFASLILGFTFPRLTHLFLPHFVSNIAVDAAIGIYSAVASGMIALTGIVFSLTFVAVQFSATAYSPRIVLWIARDPVISHAIGVFTATFLYALTALAWVDRSGSGQVPFIGAMMLTTLLIISVIMFISLIHRVGMLQVNRILIFVGDQGRAIIESLYPPLDIPARAVPEVPSLLPCLQTLLHSGHPRFVQAVDVPALVEVARKNGCTVELAVSVGDAVQDTSPILRVLGVGTPLPERHLRAAIALGSERTFEQDPKYAIRLLVDIGIRALSPAVNDPTTAVQALDQIEDLLIRLGRRRLEIGAFRDAGDNLRLLIIFPRWEDFLRLAFDEIRFYGATSIQVMRRMRALVAELIAILPEERRGALRDWQERLQSSVNRSFIDQYDKTEASAEDRQGLGITRRHGR